MALLKLQNCDAFVVRDLDTETPAIGIVRSAKKILQGGAKDLARSQTYQCAALGMRMQGASAGVNALPEDRDQALAAFSDELTEAVSAGSLMIDAAKGVSTESIAALSSADARNAARLTHVGKRSMSTHLAARGAVSCAATARSLDGAAIAIENFDDTGAAIAEMVTEAGARIVAVSTSAGAAMSSDGFSVDMLVSALANNGPAMVGSLSDEEIPFWKILGADCDVLFAGSKMGVVDHKGAENVKASLLVPTGPIPYTTKGALVLERQDTTVLPDFVTTAGNIFAGFPPHGEDQASLEAAVTAQLSALTDTILGKKDIAILEACYQAETFLGTWREELPFGRPFAA